MLKCRALDLGFLSIEADGREKWVLKPARLETVDSFMAETPCDFSPLVSLLEKASSRLDNSASVFKMGWKRTRGLSPTACSSWGGRGGGGVCVCVRAWVWERENKGTTWNTPLVLQTPGQLRKSVLKLPTFVLAPPRALFIIPTSMYTRRIHFREIWRKFPLLLSQVICSLVPSQPASRI